MHACEGEDACILCTRLLSGHVWTAVLTTEAHWRIFTVDNLVLAGAAPDRQSEVRCACSATGHSNNSSLGLVFHFTLPFVSAVEGHSGAGSAAREVTCGHSIATVESCRCCKLA